MAIPINVWTVSAALTVAVWTWMLSLKSRGDYDFGPAVVGFIVMVGTACWWAALLIGRFL